MRSERGVESLGFSCLSGDIVSYGVFFNTNLTSRSVQYMHVLTLEISYIVFFDVSDIAREEHERCSFAFVLEELFG